MASENGETLPLGDDADLIAIAREYERACNPDVDPPELAGWLDRVAPGQQAVLLRRLAATAADKLTEQGVEDAAERLASANPALADDLRRLLDSRDAPTTGHQSDSPCGLLRIRCPHCRNPIEVVADSDIDSVACPSCGSDFDLAGDPPTRVAEPSRTIAHFDLIERVGAGAFGEVWKAHDTKLDRTVAVKIPRRGALDRMQEKLFLREAQSAAQLSHPRIVPVYEVGRDDDTLYIVSDFVRGLTLADWLSGQTPTSREAAEYARQIAEALEHAHERGVVHRDLKPGNVMLDNDGGCRLMDFGLARRDAGAITMTRDGQVLGTPAYMSPEQARGDAHAADRRSDVYSLGVILFELLTGERPFRGNERMLLHQVIHDEPPSPRKLNAAVPRDLETISLKCLQKNPEGRYASSRELGEELARWLRGEAIEARPIGPAERSLRWIKRNPAVAALTGAVAASLIIGSIVSTLFALRASAVALERDVAAKHAKSEQADGEAVIDLLVSAFQRPDPSIDGRDIRVAEVLLSAAERANDDLADQPGRLAKLLSPISTSLKELGLYSEAIAIGKRSLDIQKRLLGAEDLETLETANNLASAYLAAGWLKEALAVYEENLATSKAIQGRNHPDTLHISDSLADVHRRLGQLDEAVGLYEVTLKARQSTLGENHRDTLATANSLATAYEKAGRLSDALPLYEATLEARETRLGKRHHETLETANYLANAYKSAGRIDEALSLCMTTLESRRESLGDNHQDSLVSAQTLADIYDVADGLNVDQNDTLAIVHTIAYALREAKRFDEALALYERTLAATEAKLGKDHPDTLSMAQHVAQALSQVGRLNEALRIYETTLEESKVKLGDDHPDTMKCEESLAYTYWKAERFDEALPLYEASLAARKAMLGEHHAHTLALAYRLATVYRATGHIDKALSLSEATLAMRKAKYGEDHPDTLSSLHSYAYTLRKAGRFQEALSLYKAALTAKRAKLGKDHPDTFELACRVAMALRTVGQLDAALKIYESTLQASKAKLGEDHPDTLKHADRLASAYKVAGRLGDALPLYEAKLVSVKSRFAHDHPRTLASAHNVAYAMRAVGRIDEAISLYEGTLESRRATLGDEHRDTLATANNLALTYKAAGRLREALSLSEATLAARTSSLGKDHPDTQYTAAWLAALRKQLAEGER